MPHLFYIKLTYIWGSFSRLTVFFYLDINNYLIIIVASAIREKPRMLWEHTVCVSGGRGWQAPDSFTPFSCFLSFFYELRTFSLHRLATWCELPALALGWGWSEDPLGEKSLTHWAVTDAVPLAVALCRQSRSLFAEARCTPVFTVTVIFQSNLTTAVVLSPQRLDNADAQHKLVCREKFKVSELIDRTSGHL